MPRPFTPAELDRLAEIASIGQRLTRDLDCIKDAIERGDPPDILLGLVADTRHVSMNAFCRVQLLLLNPERPLP